MSSSRALGPLFLAFALLIVSTGCGRLGFDPSAAASDAGDDPTSDARVDPASDAAPTGADAGALDPVVLAQEAIDLNDNSFPKLSLQDLTVDAAGNAYLIGSFSNGTFDGEAVMANGSSDIYIASLADGLGHRWLRSFGGSLTDHGLRVFWRDDNLYSFSQFSGTIDTQGLMVSSLGQDDHLVLAMDDQGQIVKWKAFGSTGDDDFGRGLFIDSARHVYVGGSCSDSFSYGGDPLVGDGSRDPCMAHLDQDMGHVSSGRLLGPGTDAVRGIALFPSGGALVVGYFNQTLTIDNAQLTSNGGADVFALRIAADGTVEWAEALGGDGDDFPEHVLIDSDGYMYIALNTTSSEIDFDGQTIPLDTNGGTDALLIAADEWGNLHWGQLLTGPGGQTIEDIALLGDGTLAFAGGYEGMPRLNGELLPPANGDRDLLVGVTDRWGNLLWQRTAGSAGFDSFTAVASHPEGGLVVGGVVTGAVDLGTGPIADDTGAAQLVIAHIAVP